MQNLARTEGFEGPVITFDCAPCEMILYRQYLRQMAGVETMEVFDEDAGIYGVVIYCWQVPPADVVNMINLIVTKKPEGYALH